VTTITKFDNEYQSPLFGKQDSLVGHT